MNYTKRIRFPRINKLRRVRLRSELIAVDWLRRRVSEHIIKKGYVLLEVKKTMTEEEAEAIRAQNEIIRKERDVVCDKIATKFAQFKRDFLSAPMRKAMKCV